MAARKEAQCVLDGSTTPATMRCEHCRATEPISLPMPMSEVVGRSNAFQQKHAFCHLSLTELRSKQQHLQETLNCMRPNHRAYDATRGKLYQVEAAIRRLEPNPNKWP
jgi:transcription elongation factor Elf1